MVFFSSFYKFFVFASDDFWLFSTIFVTQLANRCDWATHWPLCFRLAIFFSSRKLYIENVTRFRFVCTFVPLFGMCIHFIFTTNRSMIIWSRLWWAEQKRSALLIEWDAELNWNRIESMRVKTVHVCVLARKSKRQAQRTKNIKK